MSAPALASRRARLTGRAFVIACACGGLAGAVMGLAFPLISLSLETRFGSGPVIGLNAAAGAVSTLLGAVMMPSLFRRYGLRQLIVWSSALGAVFFLAFLLTDALIAWFALRFLFGWAATIVFVAAETWVNRLAPAERRARDLGIFAAALAGGLGVGAATFAFIGENEPVSFMVGAGFLVVAALLARLPAPAMRASAERGGMSTVAAAARAAPIAIVAALAFGAIETATLNFLPVYGVRADYGRDGASALVIAYALGNLILIAPLARLADSFGRGRTLLLYAGASAVLPLLIMAGPAPALLYAAPLVFFYSGIATALYPVGLARLAERVPTAQISQANAAFVVFYGLGSLISPPAVGAMIDAIRPDGLWIALSALAAALFAAGALSALRNRPR